MLVLRAHVIPAWVLGVLLFAAGCREQKKSESSTQEIARVGAVSISRDDYEALLNLRAHGDTNRFARPDAKEALLDELVRREAILARAKAAGFDERPDVKESVKRLIVAKFEAEQRKAEANDAPPSEQEIATYYQDHTNQFAVPARVHGAIIFLKISPLADAPRRAEAMEKAQTLLARAKAASPQEFAQLVAENSEDVATRYQGGDVGWFALGTKGSSLDPEVAEALFALKQEGEVAPLVTTKKGIYIVRLIGSTPAGTRPLKEVADLIAYTITKEKQSRHEQEFYAAMKTGLDIQINRPLLESLRPQPATNGSPSALSVSSAQVK